MAAQEKISVYSLADLKNTSDDAIPNYLNSLKFTQSHKLTDVRLALGYSAFALAGACFLWDYKLGFESTKYLTAAAVVIYTLLNGALTLWIWRMEKGTVYVGRAPSGETISISTSTKKNVPDYIVNITVTPAAADAATTSTQIIDLRRPFTEWFDGAGHFVARPFQSMLASSVPAIGRLDPKRVVAASPSNNLSPELLDAVLAAEGATGTDVKATPSGGKKGGGGGGKRRKA